MALPTLTKTWNFSVNNVIPPSGSYESSVKDYVFNIKNLLVTSGNWTVVSSSNGTTFNTSDNWTSASALNFSNQPWIVLRHPTNNASLLIDIDENYSGGRYPTFYYSHNGYLSSGFSVSTPPSPIVSGDNTNMDGIGNAKILNGSTQQLVFHYIWSADGYCHRQIIYCLDVPILCLIFDTIETDLNLTPPFTQSSIGEVAQASVLYASASPSVYNILSTNIYTSSLFTSRLGPIGSAPAQNTNIWLSGEAYNNNLLTNGITVPNDFTGEYPILETGLFANGPYHYGKIGKLSDLWYGIYNLAGSVTYPNDNTRQFAQHGCLITPWNGSVMITR